MKSFQTTTIEGNPIDINTNYVAAVEKSGSGSARIFLSGSVSVTVKESSDSIMAKIQEADK